MIDPAHDRLEYVSAGPEPALLIRKRAQRAERLDSTGTVLGLSSKSAFTARTVRVHAGDTFVVCTDGVFDALDSKDAAVKDGKVPAGFSAIPTLAPVISWRRLSARPARASTSERDDRTAVVVRFTEPANQAIFSRDTEQRAVAAA